LLEVIGCVLACSLQASAFSLVNSRYSNKIPSAKSGSFIQTSLGAIKKDVATSTENSAGLYKHFADHVWSKLLQETDWFEEDTTVPSELMSNTAPAKGMPEGSVVKITTRALVPSSPDNAKKVRYARYALLETLLPSPLADGGEPSNSTEGIQVLNMVIFPAADTNLPVFGADVVSLPGNRHLLLLDAQPMDNTCKKNKRQYQHHFVDWYKRHVVGDNNYHEQQMNGSDQTWRSPKNDSIMTSFPWGGDMPEEVAPYVSDYALWTRLVPGAENDDDDDATHDPITKIQGDFWHAFKDHLDQYLDLLNTYTSDQDTESLKEQIAYVDYRLNNDPAKPMLKSLYGEEWTERVLQEVLFPNVR